MAAYEHQITNTFGLDYKHPQSMRCLKAAPKDDMAAFKVKVFSHCLDICFRFRILLILYISVSLNQPARVLGLFLSSYLSEKLGRKRCLILCSLAQLLSR